MNFGANYTFMLVEEGSLLCCLGMGWAISSAISSNANKKLLHEHSLEIPDIWNIHQIGWVKGGSLLCWLGKGDGLVTGVIYTFNFHHQHHHQSRGSLHLLNVNFQPNYRFILAGDLSPNILYPIIARFIGWSVFKHKSPSVLNIFKERQLPSVHKNMISTDRNQP